MSPRLRAVVLVAAVLSAGACTGTTSPDAPASSFEVDSVLAASHPAPPYEGTAASITGQAWADYDADGRLDLYVTDQAGPSTLYHAEPDGSFEIDVWAEDVSLPEVASTRATWQELDGDPRGLPELAVLTSGGIRLFRNDGAEGGFADVTRESGLPAVAASALAWNDFDGDGRLDLFLASLDGTWGLWHNEGGLGFSPETVERTPGPPVVAAAFWDLVGDDAPDLFLVRPDRTQLLTGSSWQAAPAPSITDGRSLTLAADADGASQVLVALERTESALSVLTSDGTGLLDTTSEWPDVRGPAYDVALVGGDSSAYVTRDGEDAVLDGPAVETVGLGSNGSGLATGVGGRLARGAQNGPHLVLASTSRSETGITLVFGYGTIGATVLRDGAGDRHLVGVGPATGSGHAPAVTLTGGPEVEATIRWPDGNEQTINVTDESSVWRVVEGAPPVPVPDQESPTGD